MRSHATLCRASKAAFTLIEMMVVLAIIAMLIGVGVVTLKHIEDHPAVVAAQSQIETLKSAVLGYKTVNRQMPRNLDDLMNPPKEAVSKKPLTDEKGLTDPWGRRFQMRVPGKKSGEAYDLYSMGPDPQDEGDDVYP